MESHPSFQPTKSFWQSQRLMLKAILVLGLVLLLLIPGTLVLNLVRERAGRLEQVRSEVSGKWAGSQTLTGPVLLIPYTELTGTAAQPTRVTKWLHVLPDELRATGNLQPEERSRGVYSVALYRAALKLEGRFSLPQTFDGLLPENIQWSGARLVTGLTDVRGLDKVPQTTWNGQPLPAESEVPEAANMGAGIAAAPVAAAGSTIPFSMSLSFRGSGQLYFTPVGKETTVSLQSAWRHPAYDGQFLPTTGDTPKGGGFAASWTVLQHNRTFPQVWRDAQPDLHSADFGVRLVQPTAGYTLIERCAKYAVLFIALTFSIFFFLEIFQKRQVHPLQYTLVGLALCVFYTLLLSFSEYFGFNSAYLIAAAATILLITFYTGSIFHSFKTGTGFGAALSALYGYIFIIVQMEDLSLLFGSVGLFVIIALLMYFSRKVDWYSIGRGGSDQRFVTLSEAEGRQTGM